MKMRLLLLESILLIAEALSTSLKYGLRSVPSAFSREECIAIREMFVGCEVEIDRREEHGIRRINRWLKTPAPRWLLNRVLEAIPLDDMDFWRWETQVPKDADERIQFLSERLDFVLLHEFSAGDFFDWHSDTKPGDGTWRTINVNVVLSESGDFEGGELQVGEANASLGLGDLHAYPAALPHKVHDILRGRRHTLVLAVRGGPKASKGEPPEARKSYWHNAALTYEALCRKYPDISKLHWIFGDFFAAQDDQSHALIKYADAYRNSQERDQYISAFAESAADHHANGRLPEALADLQLCHAIDPDRIEHTVDLAVLLYSIGHLDAARTHLDTALAKFDHSVSNDQERLSAQAAMRAALSLVLKDKGLETQAERQRTLAIELDPDTAHAAFEHLLEISRTRPTSFTALPP